MEFLRTAVSSDSNLNQIYNEMIENQFSFISMYNDDKTKIENRLNDYISRFFEPKSKNDMKKLHNIIIEQAMIYNQRFMPAQENSVVRKDEFSSFSNDDTSEESFVDDNEKVLDEDSSNVFDESSNNSKSKTDNQQKSKEKQQSENQINKTHIDFQKSSYAASLLLSRLAYAMSSLIIQNIQNREDKRRQKNNNHKAKFASKNHQITKAHFEPQTPIQY